MTPCNSIRVYQTFKDVLLPLSRSTPKKAHSAEETQKFKNYIHIKMCEERGTWSTWHALGNRRVRYWVSVRKPEGKEIT